MQISAGSTVTWNASSSASWLTALPASGTGNGQITVSVNPAGLSAGNYSGIIRITDSSGGVISVLVTYAIADKPALVISPPVLVFTTASDTSRLRPNTDGNLLFAHNRLFRFDYR